ncbi:MAG: M28 family peptidase [Bacteroidota bacterium]
MQKPAFVSLLFFLLYLQNGFTQDSIAIHYARKITPDDVRPYLEVLTSDSLEGRETGKPGQKKAAAYIANHFQSLGLKPISHGGYSQHTSLSARANSGRNFKANDQYLVFMRDYFYQEGFADSLYIMDKIVFAGAGISEAKYDDYKNQDVKERVVLFFDRLNEGHSGKIISESWNLESKLLNAKVHGAALALVITDSLENIMDDYYYHKKKPAGSPIPFAYVTRTTAKEFLQDVNKSRLEKAEKKTAKKGKPQSFGCYVEAQFSFVKETDPLRGENVLGFLEGTDRKEEVIILTAHYDHLGIQDSLIYHGADDDGSGTAAVMEMAKVFTEAANAGHRPRRSILFMTVSGEEKGLLGSKYYVKHPVIPLLNTVANLNTDMIGRTDEKHDSLSVRNYVYVIGSDKLSTTLHRVNEEANESFPKLELDYTFNNPDDPNRFYYRSDHYNFAKNKIPIIFYFNGSHKDYHKPTDTIDKIQFDLLAKRAQLVFLTAWQLANREERIKVDVVSDMPDKKED